MDLSTCESWAGRLRRVAWYDDLRTLGQSLRAARRETGRLLVVGHPDEEPWHLAAHLDLLARYRDIPELQPTLADGPAAGRAGRSDTILVVAERPLPGDVLEQLAAGRRQGSTLLGLHTTDPELDALAHDAVRVEPAQLDLGIPGIVGDFEIATHLFGVAAASPRRGWFPMLRRSRA